MDKSTISQLPGVGRRLSASVDVRWRRRMGHELRRIRADRGLSQGALGHPLSKAFVSAVENGRVVPSLPALRLMTERLGISLADFFATVDAPTVERGLTDAYDVCHEDDTGPDPTSRSGGQP